MRPPTAPDISHYRFLLPPDKDWFSAKEVATLIGKTDQYIRDCYDSQRIPGHASSGHPLKGRETRRTYSFHRDCVLLFLMETANFEPADFMERLLEILSNRTPEQLHNLRRRLDTLHPNRLSRALGA